MNKNKFRLKNKNFKIITLIKVIKEMIKMY